MTHLWVRAEQRENEDRVGLTPDGARRLIEKGIQISVEDSQSRIIPIADYADAGCEIVGENTWPDAPNDAIIFGLKELPEDGTPLIHRHIMFGHAFKGQHSGKALLQRFQAGSGTLYDLEYLTDATGFINHSNHSARGNSQNVLATVAHILHHCPNAIFIGIPCFGDIL